MKAIEVHNHLSRIGTWVDWDKTCDGFKAGDHETELTAIAVSWISVMPALKEAHQLGCNMFVTHEPTFYARKEDDEAQLEKEPGRSKKAWLDETGMVIYRCHDVWDRMPGIGILDSWAKGLGFEQPALATAEYHAVYRSPAHTLGELASHVASKVKPIGQELVQVIGDFDRRVSKVAVGTGAITHAGTMLGLGADVLIVTDDGTRFWADGASAIDLGVPVMVVNHATAEEWGIANLAKYLARQFPDVPVYHIPQGCLYRMAAESG